MMVRSKVCHSWYYCRGHSISISISKTNVARCQLSEEIWQGWERCHREARRCSCCQWDVTCYPELAPSEFCSSRQQKASRLSDCLDPGGGDDDWLASRVAWGQIFLSGLSAWPMIRSSGYCILPLVRTVQSTTATYQLNQLYWRDQWPGAGAVGVGEPEANKPTVTLPLSDNGSDNGFHSLWRCFSSYHRRYFRIISGWKVSQTNIIHPNNR